MRRRSVSALSTAAVAARLQLGDLGGVDLRRRSGRAAPGPGPARAGDADGHPRGDEHEPDDADERGQPGPSAGADLEEVELRRSRRAARRRRPASAAIASEPPHAAIVRAKPRAATGRLGEVVGDLLPPGRDLTRSQSRRSGPRLRAAGPGRRSARPSARRPASARRGPSPRDSTNSSQANGKRQQERDQQPDCRRQQGDGHAEGDRRDRAGPSRRSRAPGTAGSGWRQGRRGLNISCAHVT